MIFAGACRAHFLTHFLRSSFRLRNLHASPSPETTLHGEKPLICTFKLSLCSQIHTAPVKSRRSRVAILLTSVLVTLDCALVALIKIDSAPLLPPRKRSSLTRFTLFSSLSVCHQGSCQKKSRNSTNLVACCVFCVCLLLRLRLHFPAPVCFSIVHHLSMRRFSDCF